MRKKSSETPSQIVLDVMSYYGLSKEKIEAKYPGSTCLGEWAFSTYPDTTQVVCYNPNPASGHKKFFSIFSLTALGADGEMKSNWYIAGVDEETAKKEAVHIGIYSRKAGKIIYSTNTHDYRTNGGSMIDGGKSYLRYSLGDDAEFVSINMLTSEIIFNSEISK